MLTSLHLHTKSSEVSIKTRSTPALLSIQARTLSTQLWNGLLFHLNFHASDSHPVWTTNNWRPENITNLCRILGRFSIFLRFIRSFAFELQFDWKTLSTIFFLPICVSCSRNNCQKLVVTQLFGVIKGLIGPNRLNHCTATSTSVQSWIMICAETLRTCVKFVTESAVHASNSCRMKEFITSDS